MSTPGVFQVVLIRHFLFKFHLLHFGLPGLKLFVLLLSCVQVLRQLVKDYPTLALGVIVLLLPLGFHKFHSSMVWCSSSCKNSGKSWNGECACL